MEQADCCMMEAGDWDAEAGKPYGYGTGFCRWRQRSREAYGTGGGEQGRSGVASRHIMAQVVRGWAVCGWGAGAQRREALEADKRKKTSH